MLEKRPFLSLREIEVVANSITGIYRDRNILIFRFLCQLGLSTKEICNLTFSQVLDGDSMRPEILLTRRRRGNYVVNRTPTIDRIKTISSLEAPLLHWKQQVIEQKKGNYNQFWPLIMSRRSNHGVPRAISRQQVWLEMTLSTEIALERKMNPEILEWTYMVHAIRNASSVEHVVTIIRSRSELALIRVLLQYIQDIEKATRRVTIDMEIWLKALRFLEDEDNEA